MPHFPVLASEEAGAVARDVTCDDSSGTREEREYRYRGGCQMNASFEVRGKATVPQAPIP